VSGAAESAKDGRLNGQIAGGGSQNISARGQGKCTATAGS
jgi:hypothetical protein